MTNQPSYRRRSALLAGAVLAGLAGGLAAAGPASAREKQLVSFSGLGTHEPGSSGSVAVAGEASGDPFDGAFSGLLVPADGSLPAPGDCEPATATLRLDGPRNRYLVLDNDEGNAEVCGEFTSSTNRVTHVYTGRYRITETNRRRLVGSDGWYEIRLADNDMASVTAVDT